ncbi:hypothetical protein like AT5G12000 [Hibiscus trionum]|uniref:Protein kinase domain-containing protein n=1 Tax=Hibiscus trionum TaxID=183268 RepID=A0A9W7HX53_HIBTR|nr:hypothetical protein like AT5G12000 [Hibiscus trionum]
MEETSGLTVVAVDRNRSSQLAVKWTVDNLLHPGSKCFLVHVINKTMHSYIEATPIEGRPPSETEMQLYFLSYRGYCARKGIESHEVILHGVDVPTALLDYVNNNNIRNIVVGASTRNVLTRKLKNPDVPSSLLKFAPESCGVYVISKGKVQASRLASRSRSSHDSTSSHSSYSRYLEALLSKRALEKSEIEDLSSGRSPDHFDAGTYRSVSGGTGRNYRITSDRTSDHFQVKPCDKLNTNKQFASPKASKRCKRLESLHRISIPESTILLGTPNSRSTDDSSADDSDSTDYSSSSFTCLTPRTLEFELRRLRKEIEISMEMLKSVSKEAGAAKEKLRTLQEWKAVEERKLEEARLAEEAAVALAKAEREKAKAAVEAAQVAQRLAEMEARKRKLAESKANREEEEKKRALDKLVNNKPAYRKYTIDDVEAATDYFSGEHKIGEGGYGTVFKGTLDHTAVAIKVLRQDISQGQKQFQQEVEVLSCMRHPHLVLLMGACPENGCLVYEYMENGSLEDRLFRKDNTPPIPWKTRFRIAAEIATGILFLHQTKPEPLVHRDLKPANILLDRNYVSKISDVGLSRMVPAEDDATQDRLTQARGTFCYIDPEYQQTGILGVKSDLYSFGVVLLQLITAKPPVGLCAHVQEAVEKGTLAEILDPAVPDWPVEEALSLAKLALQCCELRKRDRPDLNSVVLPELNRLRDLELEHESNNSEIQHQGNNGEIQPEVNNSKKVASEALLHNSVPENRSLEIQITKRSSWQQLKPRTRVWKSSILPSNRGPAGESNRKPGEPSCSSFKNCTETPQQLQGSKSFST